MFRRKLKLNPFGQGSMRRSSIHCLNTRNRQDLNIPKCKTSLAQRSFRYRAAKLWNAIPSKVKDSPTLNSFKRSIKNWFLMDNDSIILISTFIQYSISVIYNIVYFKYSCN